METLQCPQCNRLLPITAFSKNKCRLNGLQTYCKECTKHHKAKSRYGIELFTRDKLMTEQDGKCKFCSKTEAELGKALHIDHDHQTGQVRGLLCDRCNRGIGMFAENVEWMTNAINYITEHRNKR